MCCGIPGLRKSDRSKAIKMVVACEVCIRVDDDCSEKECEYCHVCQAFICKPCETKVIKRTWAAIKKLWSGI